MLDIGEVSRASGMAPSALRFYEEKGLIRSQGRRGLRRLFGEEVLQRLALIRLGQRAGFSLEEVADLLSTERLDRQRLLARAEEIDQKIGELKRMRDGLRHAAACPAEDHFQCPKFLRLLRLTSGRKGSLDLCREGR
jgi:DNA-binding transcriptional MerR regulator